MKQILYNEQNLQESDINRTTKRAKILIINSNNEILLVHCNNNYFFVGGRVEENESFIDCIKREIKEETGVSITIDNIDPFYSIVYMNKDYPKININTKSIINYYCIKNDIKPDLEKISLTDDEKDGNFELIFIHKDNIIEKLRSSLEECSNPNILNDTIKVIEEYLKNNS